MSLRFSTAACALLILSAGCGSSTSTPYLHEPLTTDARSPWAGKFDLSLGEIQFTTAEEIAPREFAIARYPEASRLQRGTSTCLVDVAPENDFNVRNEILGQLSRSWRKYFQAQKEDFLPAEPLYKDFRFDFSAQTAHLSGNFLFPSESIQYKRLCLSRELVRADAYNRMRVLELEAQNNEGTVAFAFRFKKRNDNPSRPLLLMTKRKYERYGQIARKLESVDSVFAPESDNALGTPIGVYIEN